MTTSPLRNLPSLLIAATLLVPISSALAAEPSPPRRAAITPEGAATISVAATIGGAAVGLGLVGLAGSGAVGNGGAWVGAMAAGLSLAGAAVVVGPSAGRMAAGDVRRGLIHVGTRLLIAGAGAGVGLLMITGSGRRDDDDTFGLVVGLGAMGAASLAVAAHCIYDIATTSRDVRRAAEPALALVPLVVSPARAAGSGSGWGSGLGVGVAGAF